MKKNTNWKFYRAQLVRGIKNEQAFLSSIDRGWTRVQRREPGQLQWGDYTAIQAQRSSETIVALTAIIDALDRDQAVG